MLKIIKAISISEISLFFLIISFLMMFISIVFNTINSKFKVKSFVKLINIIAFVGVISFFISIIFQFIILFIGLFQLCFIILKKIIGYFTESYHIKAYISLVITLILMAYFPTILGSNFFKLLEKIKGTRFTLHEKYIKFIEFIRPKLWIYFTAFSLAVLASIENLTTESLISNPLWEDNSPYILEAVVSFLAFDSFFSLLAEEFTQIKLQFKNIVNFIKEGIKFK